MEEEQFPSPVSLWLHTVLTINPMGMHLSQTCHSIMFIHIFNDDLVVAYLVSGTMWVLSYMNKQDTGLTVICADT